MCCRFNQITKLIHTVFVFNLNLFFPSLSLFLFEYESNTPGFLCFALLLWTSPEFMCLFYVLVCGAQYALVHFPATMSSSPVVLSFCTTPIGEGGYSCNRFHVHDSMKTLQCASLEASSLTIRQSSY